MSDERRSYCEPLSKSTSDNKIFRIRAHHSDDFLNILREYDHSGDSLKAATERAEKAYTFFIDTPEKYSQLYQEWLDHLAAGTLDEADQDYYDIDIVGHPSNIPLFIPYQINAYLGFLQLLESDFVLITDSDDEVCDANLGESKHCTVKEDVAADEADPWDYNFDLIIMVRFVQWYVRYFNRLPVHPTLELLPFIHDGRKTFGILIQANALFELFRIYRSPYQFGGDDNCFREEEIDKKLKSLVSPGNVTELRRVAWVLCVNLLLTFEK
jgi:hypothetical protein